MMKSSNNKETINLLDLSDNDSDISDLIFTPKKKKIKRRHRINRSLKVRPDNVYSCRSLRMKAILLWLTTTLIMIWLVILSWLTVILYGELRRMDITIKSVIAGSEGVPDVLQTCHTLDKNYKTNLTNISDQIKKLNRSLNIFSGQIFNLQQELRQIQISFKSAPELTSVPNIVKALQNSIGELEIDVHDLQTTYKLLKNTTLNLQYSQDQQIQSLTKLKNTLLSHTSQLPQKISNNETLVEKKKLWDAIEELHTNLTHINQTLTMNITWAQEDLSNDHKKIVSLQDMTQNTNSQILLLQQECIDRKDQKILQNLLQSLSNRIDKLSSNKTNQERPHLIEQKHNILINSTDNLLLLTHTSSETVTHKPKILSTIQKNMKNWKLNQTMKRQILKHIKN